MKTTVTVSLTFAAAHRLPEHKGKCSRLHGHTYGLEVSIEGAPQQSGPAAGMVMDFGELRERVSRLVVDRLDHQLLNDLFEEAPTTESVAAWVFELLREEGLPVVRVKLAEGPNSYVEVTD